MAPIAIKRLISMQIARETEIESIRVRLAAKPRDSLNKNIVQARLDAVREIWAETRKTHSEIISKDGAENDAYVANKWFKRIQGVYENALDEILTVLTLFEGPDGDIGASEVSSDSRVAKLPRIPLPTFSGRYEDWAGFCDLFTALVHASPGLSDATKLQYLNLCLTSGAAELVKDVAITSANYLSTWHALKLWFSNPRMNINKLLASFMEIPRMKKESASEMRTFVDEAQRIVRALENLKLPVKQWDVWLVFVLSDRLDTESWKLWEAELSIKESEIAADVTHGDFVTPQFLVRYSDFVQFLERRAQALSMISAERKAEKRPAPAPAPLWHARKVFHASSSPRPAPYTCLLCSSTHFLSRCPKFRDQSPHDRLLTTRRLQVCFNCLGTHRVNECPSARRCSICKGMHHTLLHLKPRGSARQQTSGSPMVDGIRDSRPPAVILHAAFALTISKRRVILATARVRVMNPSGGSTFVRALLDQGSTISFIAESVVQLLGLEKESTCVKLTGLGTSTAGTARFMTQVILKSTVDQNYELQTNVLILPRLTSQIPARDITDLDVECFAGLTLADPEFLTSNKVDIILGADVYGQLLREELKRFPPSHIVAQNTAFGWLISGALEVESSRRVDQFGAKKTVQKLHCASLQELDLSLQRFWELDDLPSLQTKLKPEDESCEKLFRETHSRGADGRYGVRLPLKSDLPCVAAETRQMALGSLSSMHRRFARDSKLA